MSATQEVDELRKANGCGDHTFDGLDGSANNNTVTVAQGINTATGSYSTCSVDLRLRGRTPLVFARAYNSRTAPDSPGPLGYGWTFTYDATLGFEQGGAVALVTFGSGRTDEFARLTDGSYQAAAGQFDTLTHNANGSYMLTDKNLQRYVFNSHCIITSIIDRNGNVVQITTDGAGRVVRVSAAGGNSLTFSYYATGLGAGYLSQVSDSANRTVTFGYDTSGNLAFFYDANGFQTQYKYEYPENHELGGIDNANGVFPVINRYDSAGRVIQQFDALLNTEDVKYDAANGMTSVTNARGATKTYRYAEGTFDVVRVVDPIGGSTTYAYDGRHDVTSRTDPLGHTWTFAYDSRGNVTRQTDPLGDTTTWTYDVGNQPLTQTDPCGNVTAAPFCGQDSAPNPRGHRTLFRYDSHENLIEMTDPNGYHTSYGYDARTGDRTSMTTPRGGAYRYSYDASGNQTRKVDPLGHIWTTTYFPTGLKETVTDPLGNTAHYTWEKTEQPQDQTDAEGSTTQFSYDRVGNRVYTLDPNGNVTRYGYDDAGRLVKVIDACGTLFTPPFCGSDTGPNAAGHTTRFAYDAVGNRILVTDALGHSTSTQYDLLDRVAAVTDPLGRTVSYTYDGAGNVTSKTNARGQTVGYTYDAANRLIGISYPSGAAVTYVYDADGRRTSVSDSTGTTTYSYDGDSQLVRVAEPYGSLKYTYDGDGNQTSMTTAGGRSTLYSYDAADRLTRVVYWRRGSALVMYDGANRVKSVIYPNGIIASYARDRDGRVTAITYPGRPVAAIHYAYDNNGNRVSVVDSRGTTSYTYDALSRLTSSTLATGSSVPCPVGKGGANVNVTVCYVYDAAGNRQQVASSSGVTKYTYDAADEMLSAGPITYAYDRDGNRITAVNGSTVSSYAYDADSYLTLASGASSATYAYNGDHVRVAKTVNGLVTRELIDPTTPAPTVVQMSSGGATTTYLWGATLLGQDGGSMQFLLADALGSVQTVTDAAGRSVGTRSYDAYGTPMLAGSTSVFGFTGEQNDTETGLLYLRARMYDPATGIFLQRDSWPIDPMDPRTVNRYSYVADNPVNVTDPSGHKRGQYE